MQRALATSLPHCYPLTMRLLVPLVSVFLFFSSSALADTVVGVEVAKPARKSFNQIDHSPWTTLLRKHVNKAGMVNYAAWKKSSADQATLKSYLVSLSAADKSIKSNRSARFAFWINAYNALTVYGILEKYPTSSIKNHTANVFGYNIWKDLYLRVGGGKFNLDTIEHKILRKMGDFRIHFAIVCASIGCPRLLNSAYEAATISTQLDRNARHFFSQPRHFRFDKSSSTFFLSSILDWFADDFGKSDEARLKAIAEYLPTQEQQDAARSGAVKIKHLKYDWSINKQ